MKRLFFILTLLALIFPKIALANETVNKFGIHILEVSDVNKAQELVNSSGGDWGWVTVVIRDDDMSFDKWQNFMNECREKHLIPIVRIATHLEGNNWAKPKISDSSNWVSFLNGLNWPTSERYVIIFNEPNHSKEWGGEINPQEYSRILSDFNSKLKNQNSKFKVLNAGLDLAAPNGSQTMESFRFMQEMNNEVPGIFEKLDGWSSHSYANHGFLGKPWDNKKTSVRGYEFELIYLKKLGIKKDLPVYITETGWPKLSSKKLAVRSKNKYYDEKTVAEYIKYAFENIWLKDPKVTAVTPFVLNYPADLFYDFSWLDMDQKPFLQYETIKQMPKQKSRPVQENNFSIESVLIPPFIPTNYSFRGKVTIKNTGESIWGEYGDTAFKSSSNDNIYFSDLIISSNLVKPGEKIELDYSVGSKSMSGNYELAWNNIKAGEIKVFPASILNKARYNFWQNIVLKIKSII